MTKRDILDQFLISMNEVERKHNGHWFSKDSMRFFKSRLPQDAYKIGDLYYFISSEQYMSDPRAYTLRVMTEDGTIDSVGEFQEHATKARAKSALRAIVKGLNS